MPKLKSQGFTLVELLVVISIIAILSTLGVALYSNVLKNSRDSKRQADLITNIQPALEQYFADQLYYPVLAGDACPTSSSDDGKLRPVCALRNIGGTKTYTQSIPTDPDSANSQYKYEPLPLNCTNTSPNFCTSYCLYAKMENKTADLSVCTNDSNYNFELTVP